MEAVPCDLDRGPQYELEAAKHPDLQETETERLDPEAPLATCFFLGYVPSEGRESSLTFCWRLHERGAP